MKAFALAFGWSVAGIFAIAVAGNSGPQMAEIASTGGLPRAANSSPPKIIVAQTATSGVAIDQALGGCGLFSSRIMTPPPVFSCLKYSTFYRTNWNFKFFSNFFVFKSLQM